MLLGDTGVYADTQGYPLFTMSSLPARLSAPAAVTRHGPGRNWLLIRMDGWWSQTGSNRRPQACKASALPTELWPRRSAHSSEQRSRKTNPLGPSQRMWWAWEDLNFRPHAYQARALTN